MVSPCLTARCRPRCVESVEEPAATAATHGRNHGPGDNPGGGGGLDRPRGRQATEERRSSVGPSLALARCSFGVSVRPCMRASAAFPLDLFLAGYMRCVNYEGGEGMKEPFTYWDEKLSNICKL